MAQTYPRSNMTDVTTQHEQVIEGSDTVINSTYTVSIARKRHCSVNFSVVGNGRVTKEYLMPLNFSEWSILYCYNGLVTFFFTLLGTFAVQHCDVHTDHTSYILVECTFAINSTAPGFVLIQDEHSQYTINTTLQRHEGDVSKGSVNITDLPAGEYRVTVYDEMEEFSTCMTDMNESLQISQICNLHPLSTLSVSSVYQTGTTYTCVAAYNSCVHNVILVPVSG